MTTDTNSTKKQSEDFIRIQDILNLCKSKWYWFIISFFIVFFFAVLYIKTAQPTYTRIAELQIKEDSKSKSLSSDITTFSDFGMFNSNTNVNNEIIYLKSPALMMELVKRLSLDINYSMQESFLIKKDLYGSNLPVKVSFCDLPDIKSASFTLQLQPNYMIELSDLTNSEGIIDESEPIQARLQDTIKTSLGRIVISPTENYSSKKVYEPIEISKMNIIAATNHYSGLLSISLSDDESTVIKLNIDDFSIKRAEDILNMLISIYNENWVKDKNQIAISTSLFINERLNVIERELGNVDNDISSFKSENLLPDVQAASNMYMQQSTEMNNKILDLNNQLYMARYIRQYLTNTASKSQLLPANSGIGSTSVETQITEFNTILLQRNSLVANSSEQNPLVKDYDQSLASIRLAIISSIDNLAVTLNSQIKNLERSEKETTQRIAANPTQSKYLLSVERQQKVKESLYLYLLQKREENELSQTFTAYNTRVVTPPFGSMQATTPRVGQIILIALALSLFIPLVIIIIRENFNTTIRGRKDLDSLSIPFIGEIPLISQKNRNPLVRKKIQDTYSIVVQENNRDIINEAFRMVRTNFEFMIGNKDKSKVVMLSSINVGSGKTFITMNLANSLAIKGKKVLVIDLDLRKASLSNYIKSPKVGMSNYLSGLVDDLSSIIMKEQIHENLDIIPAGVIPPNPAELLFRPQLEQAITKLSSIYDYIFIDCPPVEIVADAAIINKLVDMTLFIVRSELLERSMLPEVESFYINHKYKNMALILNGTSEMHARYGQNSYGYRAK